MAYTYELRELPRLKRDVAVAKRKNITVLEPKPSPIRLKRLQRRMIMENANEIKFEMDVYEAVPPEIRTPNEHIKYFYRWLALNPNKQLPEASVKLVLLSEAIERAKFTQKRRIRFAVDQHPELLQRPKNK